MAEKIIFRWLEDDMEFTLALTETEIALYKSSISGIQGDVEYFHIW